jgi:hypothetical protein
MTSRHLARRRALEILANHDPKKNSWRHMAKPTFGGRINHATLAKFAKWEGRYIPEDDELLVVLGLKGEPVRRELTPHEKRMRRKIAGMAKETREKVLVKGK